LGDFLYFSQLADQTACLEAQNKIRGQIIWDAVLHRTLQANQEGKLTGWSIFVTGR